MKEQLSHLPPHKQKELQALVEVLQKAIHKIDMIWLFGSYATGKWVEETTFEDGTRFEYRSDYDILVILPYNDIKTHFKVERLIDKLEKTGLLNTRASIIYHTLKEVNQALSYGSYFFGDIVKEGILLIKNSKKELAKPKPLTGAEKQQKAQEHFDQWFESAEMFFEDFESNFEKGQQNNNYYKKAAFELHQATERYFHTTLLVFTDYKAKQHDIDLLRNDVIRLDERFAEVFPQNTKEEQYRFDLLKRAYIDARYRMKIYNITREELEYLGQRVALLKKLTEEVCREKINSFLEE
ncbi:HEPN domain-containing protein [Abyssalbus ytuae]|uniref:HEPN domain-containing protein n=1 Tax=Abyssalbus ytuae TaxID=2926907 RepID=A0A9E6ZMW8_9FLAO|nr:HEPN domain-containing protein [Abyssalbus ytuae]UOB18824.1 HEPN domain-containing protein [Abyssalbus ytuae]